MSNSKNIVKDVLCSMFDVCMFGAKIRLLEFDYQEMNSFEFSQRSNNNVQVCSMFDKIVFDPISKLISRKL